MIDIHRDGIPDPSEYKEEIDGQEVSKVRLVVGRGNQNRDANKDLALRIKKVADEKYPGYVKDIYMGKGSYNQDIMPKAILLEVGTHTSDKKDVMVSMDYMSEVIAGVLGAQPQAQPNQANQAPAQQNQQNVTKGENRTGFKSAGWIIGILAVVLVAFLLILTRSGHRKEKAGNFMREVTGTNRRPPEDKNK
jgi:stage II sporulation protein P